MEEIAAVSREITLQPGGYIEQHLRDPAWWSDAAVPSDATRAVMGRMAQLSTRLVADAWHTAWALAQGSAAGSCGSVLRPLCPAGPRCGLCVGEHQREARRAGCTADDIARYCRAPLAPEGNTTGAPSPATPSPEPQRREGEVAWARAVARAAAFDRQEPAWR
jgi:hypothetical protein